MSKSKVSNDKKKKIDDMNRSISSIEEAKDDNS